MDGKLIIMKIQEIKQSKEALELYITWSNFHMNGTMCRRLVLQKHSTPHIVSEDYEILKDGKWILPSQ